MPTKKPAPRKRKRAARRASSSQLPGEPSIEETGSARPKLPAAQREYVGLRIFLSDDVGFRFGVATFDRPATRDGLMQRLTDDLAKSQVYLSALDVSVEGDSLLRRVKEHLAAVPTSEGMRRAVAVVHLEDRLTYSDIPVKGGLSGARDLTFLEDANFHRDAFPVACPCPLLFWLTAPAETALARNAPDFWHWRSARFDFEHKDTLLSDFRVHPIERIAWFEKIAAASHRLGDRRGEMNDLINLGTARIHRGDLQGAVDAYTTSLRIAQELGDRRGEGMALSSLGIAWGHLGEPRKALEHFEKDLVIVRTVNDRLNEATALGNLGIAWANLGEPQKAIGFFEQSLSINRNLKNLEGEEAALCNLGSVWIILGEPQKAIEYFLESLTISDERGNQRGKGSVLFNLSKLFHDAGELRSAVDFSEQSLVFAQETGDQKQSYKSLSNLGTLWSKLGDIHKAIYYFEQALNEARAMSSESDEGSTLYDLGREFWCIGQREKAASLLEQSLHLHQKTGDPWQQKIRAALESLHAEMTAATSA